MKFSHTADCHIGGHRDPRLRALGEQAFAAWVEATIDERCDFALIAGDLFNTAIPGIDALKFAVTQLSRLKDAGIPVYAIAGSHDYSPSGKTMIDVLERAALLVNVCKGEVIDGKLRLHWTQDPKTGVKLTGVLGKAGMLDRHLYDDLDRSIDDEPGERIFLFHTALEGLTQQGRAQPIATLPKGCRYYAGGHVHNPASLSVDGYSNIVYPGPLFPNSFSELEELRAGSYVLYDGTVSHRKLELKRVVPIAFHIDRRTVEDSTKSLLDLVTTYEVAGAIVLLRITGTLSGESFDLDLRPVVAALDQAGAYCVLRNTAALGTERFEASIVAQSTQDLEETILAEHEDQLRLDSSEGVPLARDLMRILGKEPQDGETQYAYRDRIVAEAMGVMDARRPPQAQHLLDEGR